MMQSVGNRSESVPSSRLIVVGGTGNTGLLTVTRLRQLQPEREILALVRPSADSSALKELGIAIHTCQLDDPESYVHLIRHDDVLLEMANLRFARQMLPMLANLGIRRAFCVTTTGVFSKHHSYSALYREIEQEMRNSPIKVTILRPSMIYGNERDHNMHKLIRFIKLSPIFPIFGNGRALMQPVHVADLAEGIAQAVVLDAEGEYNLAGPQPLRYIDVIRTVFRSLGKYGLIVFVPVDFIARVVVFMQKIPGFPIKHEQVIRLQEDKSFDISAAQRDLNYAPRPFELGIAQEILAMRSRGNL